MTGFEKRMLILDCVIAVGAIITVIIIWPSLELKWEYLLAPATWSTYLSCFLNGTICTIMVQKISAERKQRKAEEEKARRLYAAHQIQKQILSGDIRVYRKENSYDRIHHERIGAARQ